MLDWKLDETRNYLLEETKHDLISEKHKRRCRALNYLEHFFFFVFISAVSGYGSISAFVSLVGLALGVVSSVVAL